MPSNVRIFPAYPLWSPRYISLHLFERGVGAWLACGARRRSPPRAWVIGMVGRREVDDVCWPLFGAYVARIRTQETMSGCSNVVV